MGGVVGNGCIGIGSGAVGCGTVIGSALGESPPGSGGGTRGAACGALLSSDLSKIASGSRKDGVSDGPPLSGDCFSVTGAGLLEGELKLSPGNGGRSSLILDGVAGGPSSDGNGGSISDPGFVDGEISLLVDGAAPDAAVSAAPVSSASGVLIYFFASEIGRAQV